MRRPARIALRAAAIALALGAVLVEAGGRRGAAIGEEPLPPAFGNPREPTPPLAAWPRGDDAALRVAFLGDVQGGVGDVARPLLRVARDERVDLVVQHGDLVSHGEAPYYGVLGRALRGAGWPDGVPVWVVPGNHDVEPDGVRDARAGRRVFEERVGPRWWAAVAVAGGAPGAGGATHPAGSSLLVVGLDDAVEPAGPEQLTALDAWLAAAPGLPWILAIHKPPRLLDRPGAPPMPGMEGLLVRLEARPPVAVVSGHLHEDLDTTVAGVRYVVNANGGDLDTRGPRRAASVLVLEAAPGAPPAFRRVPLSREPWLAVELDRLWVRLWAERRRAPWAPAVAAALAVALLLAARRRAPSPSS